MITVHGRKTSSNVQAVMWTIGELGLAHERLDLGHNYGGTDTAQYRKMNPMGLVPTIQDGELILFESGAIVRYLAAQYGDEVFYPQDPAHRAKMDVWAEWAKTSFYPVLIGEVFFPLVRLDPATVDQEVLDASVQKLNTLANMLDDALAQGLLFQNGALSYADVMVGHLLYRYFELDFTRPSLKNLRNYYDTLRARPAYQNHVMVSYEPLRWAPAPKGD